MVIREYPEEIEKCFEKRLTTEWKDKLIQMIPSYGKKLAQHPELIQQIRDYSKDKLELDY